MQLESVKNSQQWKECLSYMSRRVTEQSFNTWLKPTKGEPGGNGHFRIAVPNQFVADWIDGHYRELIHESFREVLGRRFEVIYIQTGRADEEDQTTINFESIYNDDPEPPLATTPPTPTNLETRYSFETLVVGDFNRFACAASMAVADGPGTTRYNPLYIYGGTGLGKTHIVQAIGNHILEQLPDKRIVYVTSEKFTSDFITAIQDRSISSFTRMYREVDVLIIDDIQFFTGKESTQEQFFHTFNALYHNGKQIILTSDRPPREIKGLEERLLSRFSWGLVTDLQSPDLENRMAILQKKLESEGKTLPNDVVRFIANTISSNIRELEGALTRVLAWSSIQKTPVDIEMARKVLSDSISKQRTNIDIPTIQRKAAQYYNLDPLMMTAKKKTAHIALARQVAMYLARSLTNNSLKAIGGAFGGRDHSTVIHACDLVEHKMSSDASFREEIDKLSASLLY